MEYTFQIHWILRKGLGPDWIPKTSTIHLDDLPNETTFEEAKSMAVSDFKAERYRNGTSESTYAITDINLS